MEVCESILFPIIDRNKLIFLLIPTVTLEVALQFHGFSMDPSGNNTLHSFSPHCRKREGPLFSLPPELGREPSVVYRQSGSREEVGEMFAL